MRRKIFSILLAVVFVLQVAAIAAFADTTPPTKVSVPINVEVSKGSIKEWTDKVSVEGNGKFSFDFRAVMDTESIRDAVVQWYNYSLERLNAFANGDDDLYTDLVVNHLDPTEFKGEFEVTVTYPAAFQVPEEYITGGSMQGFNDGAKIIFHEVGRTLTVDGDTATLKINIETNSANGAPANLTAKDMYDNREAYLPELTFTVSGVSVSGVGTYTVEGALEGETVFQLDGKGTPYTVTYEGVANKYKDLTATVKISKPTDSGTTSGGSYSSSGLTPGGTTPSNTSSITVWFNGNQVTVGGGSTSTGSNYTVWDLMRTYPGTRWFLDEAMTQPADPDTPVNANTKLYGGRRESDTYETEDHFAYIMGYPDGTVRPANNITREEVATILYRLLKAEKRAGIYTEVNDFSDVAADRWSNHYISTMANGAYILGYEDGTFAPAKNITRAEFATMIVRYAEGELTAGSGALSDISGHWAENYILTAVGEGWIAGYEDGTFAPDKYITRAEAMTILNRMLGRKVNATGLHADAKIWIDNSASSWYYYEVEEATNAHEYTRQADGLTETWDTVGDGILGETM